MINSKLFYPCMLVLALAACRENITPERETDFNYGWKFGLEDTEGAGEISFDDSGWRHIRLPHDWSVEASFDSVHGEGATGYLPGGIGWYRKHFRVDNPAEKTVYIHFDGIYNNSTIWLNGEKLGFHPYGYSPFYFNITPYLRTDGEANVLAVRVDRTRYVDSRWYTGSGIYRNVTLVITDRLHIPVWGTFITTPQVSDEKALVNIETTVMNGHSDVRQFELLTSVYGPSGDRVGEMKDELSLEGNVSISIKREVPVDHPVLWGIGQGNLYRAVREIVYEGKVVDRYETPFGIRSFRFDPDSGFFLNGKHELIKGVCLHHDGGLTGAAVPKGVWKRRLEMLREGGCNAIRSAHNPASSEFLDLCDEMGFLVQDEFFDEWDNPKDKRLNTWEKIIDSVSRGYTRYFQQWAERDLKSSMLSHRNHPCIVQWSIGNEIEWTYPRYKHATGFFDMDWKGNYFWSQPPLSPEMIKRRFEDNPPGKYVLAETARKLAGWTREMDTTRPVIANCILPSASYVTGYIDALDIAGFSYRRVLYGYGHELHPDKPIMGTENLGQWHEWKAVLEHPHIAGIFIWTGIDYLGEAHGDWPAKGTNSGLLDFAGFPKPSWHMFKTLWADEPHVYIASQAADKSIFRVDENGNVVEKRPGAWQTRLWSWHPVNEHWNYASGEPVMVEVMTNCPEVELLLNGKSLGSKKLSDFEDRIMKWSLPFEAGTLEARASGHGRMVSEKVVTHGAPAGIILESDRHRLAADGYDVAHIVAQLTDADGNPVLSEDRMVEFIVSGDCRILGVDNGAVDNVQDFQSNKLVTSKGRCLMIIQSLTTPGRVKITARSGGDESAPVEVVIK